MPNFSVPLSGLDASSASLSTTANNLANLNTVGYKDQQIQFADLFYQNLGSDGAGDPIQQGAGVKVSSQPSNFTEGDVTSTGIDTDCAINGNGFFVVQQAGVQSYTRAGNFEVGTDNLLETSNGQQVMGYAATNGAINTTGGLSTLALGAGTASPAVVTSHLSLTSNLDATDTPGTTYSTQATIYDSLGAPHQVTYNFTNAGIPAVAEVNGATAQPATGTLTTSGGGAGNTIMDGSTISVGGKTYTFTTGPVGTTANAVLIGATDTATIGNLVDAINNNDAFDPSATGGGAASPGNFGTLTGINTEVTAAASTTGAFTFTAKTASATVIPTATSNDAVLSWNGGAGANGANAVSAVPFVAATGTLTASVNPVATQTVTIGSQTYTFTSTAPPGAGSNDVFIGATIAETMANLTDAINAGTGAVGATAGGAANQYGTATVANPDVTATDAGGVITVTAIEDSGSNDFATASAGVGSANLTWSASSGANGVNGVNAVTAQAATGTLATSGGGAGNTIVNGSTVSIGGVTYTFTTGPVGTTANAILIGATDTNTIGNLVDAINHSTSTDPNATGGGATTDYGTGTVANSLVTAAASSNGSFTFTAKTAGVTPVAVSSSNTAVLSWEGAAGANGLNAVTAVAGAPAVVNIWTYAVSLPAADVSGATAPVTLASGTLLFNGDGTLQSVTPTSGTASTTNPTITVPPTTTPASVFADGANPLTFTWDLFNSAGKGLVTQTAAASSTTAIEQDGASSGTLQSFNIGSDGTITGSFSNSTTATVGQIALGSFADEQGLSRDGNNDFTPTIASGQPTIGAPTSGGLGSISGGSLEASNVDIATEFANLIVAQRSYEANARVITTFDQIAQDTIALKQ
jgi:flagellar hook protein FlgE